MIGMERDPPLLLLVAEQSTSLREGPPARHWDSFLEMLGALCMKGNNKRGIWGQCGIMEGSA